MLQQGLLLMGYGLAGVFASLTLFFIIIKAITAIFPEKEQNNNSEKQ